MGFLKKIRNNILNQQNSFHVGFGNRSPFSYKGEYAGDWTPEVPDIVIPKPTSQIPVLDAEIALLLSLSLLDFLLGPCSASDDLHLP